MNSEFSSPMTRGTVPPELEQQTNVAVISGGFHNSESSKFP